MDRETTIKLARDAGIVFDDAAAPFYDRFAKLVAEHERAACAKVADGWSKRDDDVGAFIARGIRARGNT